MTRQYGKREQGFISAVIVIIITFALLKYFLNWSVIDFVQSESVARVIGYLKRFIIIVCESFIKGPATYIWNEIFVGIIWEFIVDSYEILKNWVNSKS